MDEEKQREFREGPWLEWPFGVGELIRTSGPIVKVHMTHILCVAPLTHICSLGCTIDQSCRCGIRTA